MAYVSIRSLYQPQTLEEIINEQYWESQLILACLTKSPMKNNKPLIIEQLIQQFLQGKTNANMKVNFGDDEIQIIANSLLDIQNLTELNLNLRYFLIDEFYDNNGANIIADTLKNGENIKELNLKFFYGLAINRDLKYLDEEIQSFANHLQKLQNITKFELQIPDNCIGRDGFNCLLTALENIQNIKQLEFQLNFEKVRFK
ncbi:hypothetical protein ABPG72_009330 [Tetrahymena utriculariae]